jgi:hypothetical protein
MILAGGATLALLVGLGFGALAVAPVSRAVAHAPSLTVKPAFLPAAEAPGPAPALAHVQPAKARSHPYPQYAQQAARDDPATIVWSDERAAPAPRDQPQADYDETGTRDVPYPPPPPDADGPPTSPLDGPDGD